MRSCLEVALLALLLPSQALAAYCGTSSIPYSLEILPDGSTILGCARPYCFGWDPLTGAAATHDESFQQVNGRSDGFLRAGNEQTTPFLQQQQQVSVCLSSPFNGCMQDQWVGGLYHQSTGALSVTCCTYPPLFQSEDRGIAVLHPGEIFIGGEMDGNSTFDYVQNVTEIYGTDGQIAGYNVHVRRFSCSAPQPAPTAAQLTSFQQPPVPQQVYQPQPAYYGGQSGYYYAPSVPNYQCFAADSTIQLQGGQQVRMDELEMNGWYVESPNWNREVLIEAPLTHWLHKMPEEEAEFLLIKTSLNRSLKITENHYIYRAHCNPNIAVKTKIVAGELRVGDCLMHSIPMTHALYPAEIVSIEKIKQKGIYAPLTDKGNLMVDGIAVSCYSEADQNTVIQTVLETFTIFSCKQSDTSLLCNFEKSTVTILIDLMKLVIPTSAFLI